MKTNLIPRVLKVLEETDKVEVRIRVLEMLKALQDVIDTATMR